MRNVWKRSLSLLLALVMVLSAVPMGALAEEVVEEEFFEEETTCDHVNYGETDYVSPDCTTAGYIEYTCWDCGESWTEEEEPYGHDYWDGVCTSCGAIAPEGTVEEEIETYEGDYAVSTQAANLAVDMDEISENARVGLIWLDKDNPDALFACITSGGLPEVILKAVGEENTKDTEVFYGTADASSFVQLFANGSLDDLTNALSNHKALPFTIMRPGKGETVYIICRNIRTLNVEVTDGVTLENKGCPTDLAGDVNKALAEIEDKIKITHGNDDLTELAMAKGTVTITRKSGDSFSWPETAGGSVTVEDAITVTITDDLGNRTETRYIPLTLRDTTATYTVTYYKVTGEKFQEYSVVEGSAIPVPEKDPERKYYTFTDWKLNGTVPADGKVNGDLTYTAQWKPTLDKDGMNGQGDGIADQEQSYNITFDYNYPSDVTATKPENVTVSIPWGTVISGYKGSGMPANPTLEGYVFQGWNGGTAKVTGDATVTAEWQKVDDNISGVTERTVTYHLMDDETTFQLSTQGGKAINVPYASTKDENGQKNDYVIFKGWYADPGYKTEYVFGNAVTGDMHLYGLWVPDENNNKIEDGTASDPYTIYRFWFGENGTENNVQIGEDDKQFGVATFDPNSEENKVKYTPADSLKDDVLFVEWELVEEGEANQKIENYYPVFTEEKNRNGIADNREQTALQGANLKNVDYNDVVSSITFAGEAVGFGEPFTRDSKNAASLVINTKPGYVVTAVTYSKESAVATTSLDDPLYKEEATGEGETKLTLSYSEDNQTVTATVPELAASDSENEYYALHIYFRDARKLVLKHSRTLDLAAGITKETVYNAAVETEKDASPKYDAEKVTIQYKAREATSGKVNVQKLYDAVKPYESMAPGVWNYLVSFLGLKQEGTNWFYCYELEDATCDLDAVKTIQRTPQQIVDNYIAEMVANVDVTKLNDLAQTLVNSKKQLEEKLESDTRHPFGSQAEEIVNITYKEEPWTLTAEGVTIAITDSRKETGVAVAEPMSFPYHSFSLNDVKAKLTLKNVEAAEVTLSDENIASKGVGTYTLTASFAGDETRKSCSVTFQLTITKASVAIKMPKYVGHQESFDYEKVKATAGDAAVLQIIAGWDAASLELNLAAPVVSDLKGKAWVIAPDGMDDLLEAALQKLGYSTSESINLSQFTDLVTRNREVLETRLSKTNVDRLISFLNTVSAYVDAQMDIVFGEPRDVNTGIYLNLAVLADPNYEGSVDISDTSSVNSDLEFAYGGIVISPVVAIPNRGGVQLVRGSAGAAENIFSYGPGENVDLKVTVDGKEVKNTIYYYGVTGAAAVYNSTGAPKNAGLYVAATVYYSADGTKIGSDSAIVLVGKYEADMTIYNTVNAQKEGESFAPTYDVNKKEGGKGNPDIIMISGEVAKADGDKLDLRLLKGDVYVDVPQWLGDLWKTFVTSENGKSLGLTADDATNPVISKSVLTGFLNWCIDRVGNTDDAFAEAIGTLNRLGVSDALTGKLDNIPDWLTNNLQKALEQAKKLSDGGKVIHIHTYASADKTGNDHITHYGKVGVYYYVGIIADSDYLPAVAAGGLVITENEDALVLWDTEMPYDGNGHEPIAADENAMETAMTVIRDESDKSLTILMDKGLMKALSLNAGNTLTLNDLIDDQSGMAVSKVDQIIDKMADVAKKKLEADKVDKVEEKVENLSKTLKDKMVEKLKALANDVTEGNASRTFTVKPLTKLPSAIGEYQFYTFTYGMTYDTAKLTIHPWYVSLTPEDVTINYGEQIPADFYVTAEFYSWETSRESGKVERVVSKELTLDDLDGGIIYNITCADTNNGAVGEYALSVENVAISISSIREGTHGTGTLTIKKAEKTITLDKDLTKYYDGKHDDIERTEKLDKDTKVTYTLTYKFAEAGEWELSVKKDSVKVEPENYDVTVDTNGKKMIISPAEVTIKIKDLEMTFENEKGQMVSKLDYDVISTTNREFDKDYLDKNSIIALKVAKLDSLLSDAKLPIGTYPITGTKTSKNFTITFEEGTLTVNWGKYICWNVDTGVYYDDVSKALSEAVSGQTVQMLADATQANGKNVGFLTVSEGVNFDLNGYYVQAAGAASFGGVIMDSEPMAEAKNAFESTYDDGGLVSGGILVASDMVFWSARNTGNNSYLPIYDTVTGSYKFFKGSVVSANYAVGDTKTDSVTYYFQLTFSNVEGYKVVAATENAAFDLILRMRWQDIAAFKVVDFYMDAEIVKGYADSMYSSLSTGSTRTFAMFLTVHGLEKVSADANSGKRTISAQPKFCSDRRVEAKAKELTYEIP